MLWCGVIVFSRFNVFSGPVGKHLHQKQEVLVSLPAFSGYHTTEVPTLQAPGILWLMLCLVGPVSVYHDWVT